MLNVSHKGFVPRSEMCRDNDENILTYERGVIKRWKQWFDEHLNSIESAGDKGRSNGESVYVRLEGPENLLAPIWREVYMNNNAVGRIMKIWTTRYVLGKRRQGAYVPIITEERYMILESIVHSREMRYRVLLLDLVKKRRPSQCKKKRNLRFEAPDDQDTTKGNSTWRLGKVRSSITE